MSKRIIHAMRERFDKRTIHFESEKKTLAKRIRIDNHCPRIECKPLIIHYFSGLRETSQG